MKRNYVEADGIVYAKQRTGRPVTTARKIEAFFDARVARTPTCWLWTGCELPKGYGTFSIGRNKNGKVVTLYAHRVSYQRYKGSIPNGLLVLHSCDNPSCVNPEHLDVGTPKTNTQDMVSKGRTKGQQQTHCVHGHEYTPENTMATKLQARVCRTCRGGRQRADRKKKRLEAERSAQK